MPLLLVFGKDRKNDSKQSSKKLWSFETLRKADIIFVRNLIACIYGISRVKL